MQLYHRLVSAQEAQSIREKQEVWGHPPRNYFQSDIPKVKAYLGKLPKGARGVEFTTNVLPDAGGVPGQPCWSGSRKGVTVEGDTAKIKVIVTRDTTQG